MHADDMESNIADIQISFRDTYWFVDLWHFSFDSPDLLVTISQPYFMV